MAISGIAGFALSKLTYEHGVPFPFAALIAAGLATLVGVLLAIPAVRIRGVNLAVLTLAASVAIEQLIFQNESITNGEVGAKVNAPWLFGVSFVPANSLWSEVSTCRWAKARSSRCWGPTVLARPRPWWPSRAWPRR
jgi:ABC-type branched-subunit amino acid transport system permease subunit